MCSVTNAKKHISGKSAIDDGNGGKKESFGKGWKGLNSASNYKKNVTFNPSPLSVIKCERRGKQTETRLFGSIMITCEGKMMK